VTTLHDCVGNVAIPTFFLKGLDGGKSRKWSCQHLGTFIATYNIRSSEKDSEKNMVLCKKGDDITPFDGISLHFSIMYVFKGRVFQDLYILEVKSWMNYAEEQK
jgi:hypothetical protein